MESPPLKTIMFVYSLERLWVPSCIPQYEDHSSASIFMARESALILYIYIYKILYIYIYKILT